MWVWVYMRDVGCNFGTSFRDFLLYQSCRFLFDEDCIEYKYYEFRIQEEEKALAPSKDLQTTPSG